MSLSRLTKITGPGVSTDTNWVGNNANFTGVTTTGSSFNVGVTTVHSTLIEAHNIKSTGILTATGGSFSGNVTAVDGTFSGNVSIAGTLTYEDVTNIDSVGIITAPALDVDDFLDVGSNIKLGNAGVITATSFVGDGSGLIGVASTDNIVTGTAATFTGGVDINSDLDVDGHTELDNLNVAGVTTFASSIYVADSIIHQGDTDTKIDFVSNVVKITANNKLRIDSGTSNYTTIYGSTNFTPTSSLPKGSGGYVARFRDEEGDDTIVRFHNTNVKNTVLQWSDYGSSSSAGNLVFQGFINGVEGGRFDGSGNFKLNQDLDVDGHTNLDNVSVAGVTTFSNDITFTGTNYTGAIWDKSEDHLKLNDNTRLRLGSGANDGNLRHDGTYTWFQNNNGPLLIDCGTSYLALISGNNLAGGKMARFVHNGAAELYHDNTKRLETSSVGVSIPQDLDVDGHTNLDNVSIAGVTTFSGNTTFGANGSITSSADFALSSNSLRVTGSNTVVGEFKGTSIPTVQVTQTTNNTDLQLRANSEGGLVRTATNYPLILGANQREKLRIAGGSYATIGINTSTFDNAGSQIKIDGRGTGTTSPPYLQIKGVGNSGLHAYVDLIATSDNNAGSSYRGTGVVMHDEPTNVEWFSGRPYAGSDRFIIGRKASPSYRTQSSEVANQLFRLDSDGKVTFGDGNNLASSYDATMLIDGGDNTRLTIYGGTTGTGTVAFSDGSGSGAAKMAGFIQMNHTTTDNGPRLVMGQDDTTLLHLRSPGSNRGQLEIYGNFNESDTTAIEINDGGDARKVYLTNSSGDFNALTRNGSQTKGQLKMFESGVLIHNMKNPDATSTLQTLRTGTYKVTSGSTYTSISPIQSYMQKGDANNYGCFEEGNCTLEVNGGGNDHYQPVAFVPRGYNLDTTSFGGQWAGEMWIHQTSSQNPTSYGYSGYNTWATMSFKCRWDCAHWNAKPSGFWVEHYINQGRGNIGKIDASDTMSQFVIYLLPGSYKIRWNCVRGMSVHRAVSDGASLTLRDGGSFATYSTLAYSSRNTSFDSEIAPGSASFAHCT